MKSKDIAFSLLDIQELVCFVFQLSLLRIVHAVSSNDKGIGNFNDQWAKTSHCFQTVRSRQLSRVVITRAYLVQEKIQEKDKKKTSRLQALFLLDDVLFHVNFFFLLFPFSFVLLVIMCALCIVFNKTCSEKKTRKEKKNERRRNQYARVRRYKITSTLGLLVRGDPQNEGLRWLQPRALGSKLDYLHAGITSTRLHRRLRAKSNRYARTSVQFSSVQKCLFIVG